MKGDSKGVKKKKKRVWYDGERQNTRQTNRRKIQEHKQQVERKASYTSFNVTTCTLVKRNSCLANMMKYEMNVSLLTACEAIISLMLCSYCSARMASLRVCSSFRALSTVLCSALGVTSIWWWRRALYCLVCTLHVSWNCFLICSSKTWRMGQKNGDSENEIKS